MLDLCGRFIGSGTDFEAALEKALEVINSGSFKKADIFLVTDGEIDIRNETLTEFQEQKQRRNIIWYPS